MDALSWAVAAIAALGVVGTVAEIVAVVRGRGRGLGIAALSVRVAGLAALAAFVVAARGGPDFVALGYGILGLLSAAALWAVASVLDVVLLVRNARHRAAAR